MPNVNMNDVARVARVSRGTVSNYLNNRRVRPEAQVNIERAIKQLNYVRNNAARDLRTQSSRYIVFILPTVWTPFFSELTYEVQRELNAREYKMILCISNNRIAEERDYVEMAREQKVAGIISISYSQLNTHLTPEVPLVSIEKEPTGMFPLISSDNYAGGKLAARELIVRGARQLVYIGPVDSHSDAMVSRRDGFLDYCSDHGVQAQNFSVAISRPDGQYRDDIQRTVDEVMQSGKINNLGIFTNTDEYGYQVVKALRGRGVSVPVEAQVIGFDGGRISGNDVPSLSSIRQPVHEIAESAVTAIDEIVRNGNAEKPSRVYLPVTFYEGETTKAV